MLTSTSPRELFRPMMMRFCRTMYSNSRPSSRAITSPLTSGLHCTLDGLAGADFNASRAHASLSCVLEYADISHAQFTALCCSTRARSRSQPPCLPTTDKRGIGRHLHYSLRLNIGSRSIMQGYAYSAVSHMSHDYGSFSHTNPRLTPSLISRRTIKTCHGRPIYIYHD